MATGPQFVKFEEAPADQGPQFVSFDPSAPAAAGPQFVPFQPDAPPDTRREVDLGESLTRGYVGANAQMGKTVGLAFSAPAILFDKIKSAVTGEETTAAQDYAFKNWVDPYQSSIDWANIKPEEKQAFLGKVAAGIGSLTADLPYMVISGGQSAAPKLAGAAPTAAEFTGEALHKGFDAMRPIMVKAGTEKAEEILDRGGSVRQAISAGATAAMLSGYTAAAPLSAEGKLLARMVTGAPMGAAGNEISRQVQNAASPEGMEQGFDLENAAVGAVTGGLMAGALGTRPSALPRAAAARAPETSVADALQAIRPLGEQRAEAPDAARSELTRIEPTIDDPVAAADAPIVVKPSAEILDAQTVDEAIAATKVEMPNVWRKPTDEVADTAAAAEVAAQIEAELPVAPAPATKRLLGDRGVDAEGKPWEHQYRAAENADGSFTLERVAGDTVLKLGKDGTWTADGEPQPFKNMRWAAEAAMEQKAIQSRDGRAAEARAEAPMLPEFNDIQPVPRAYEIESILPENRDAIVSRAVDRSLARISGQEVTPQRKESVRLTIDRALTAVAKGKVTPEVFVEHMDELHWRMQAKAAEASLKHSPRERGADYIRERLLQAKRRGDISDEAADMAEWFVLKNPALLSQLGVSVRTPKENATAGNYMPAERVMTIMKGNDNSTTIVHEMLHHLERMMPEEMQRAVQKEYLSRIAAEAKRSKDPAMQEYLANVLRGDRKSMETAAEMIKSGKIPYEAYQYVNPSEFWAVNMTRTAEARFRADGVWSKTRQWLTEALQHIKGALRLSSDAPMLRALDDALKNGDGKFRSQDMLSGGSIFRDIKIPEGEEGKAPGRIKKLADKLMSIGLIKRGAEAIPKIVNEIEMAMMPMSARNGGDAARATAKDYANAERNARWQWAEFDHQLEKNYTPEERQKMWEAADEQNVLLQQGLPTAGKGLDRLTDGQRATMEVLHKYGEELLQRAKDSGLFKGEGLPYWTPRMAVMIGENGDYLPPPMRSDGTGGGTSTIGRNLSTNAASLKHRKYLTVEETEAALKAALGENAVVLKDVRTMPMAMARLERAVAARELVNGIKALGRQLGKETVVGEERPDFFTIDHPAFKTFRPRMVEGEDGKLTAAIDQNGDMMFDKVPVYVAREFEGPLKSVLSEASGEVYNGMMALKGKAMSVIMYSPLIHNMVEFGRALPMMPGKMITLRVYFEGNKVKQDPKMMRFFIDKGMVPIGQRGGIQDITGIMESPELNPGRSWTAKLLSAPVSLVNKEAGQAVKRGVDAAGNFWHNTLLWDRIGDLQAGLAINIYRAETARLMKQGLSLEQAQGTAGYMAAHMANRYAGALPNEAMSALSRKIGNMALFSRSFTLGNIGVMKDMMSGLPIEVRNQIKRDYGDLAARVGTDVSRRKAVGAFIIDVALMYAANSVLQDVFDHWKRDKSWSDVAQGYVDRLDHMIHKTKESPLSMLDSGLALGAGGAALGGKIGGVKGAAAGALAGGVAGIGLKAMEELASTAGNEPGKKERILYDFDKNGTGIYMRMPMGKIGEEFVGWGTSPLDMLKRKESTFTRPLMETFTNDKGFGKRVYNPDDPGVAGATRNVGKIVFNFFKAQIPVDAIEGLMDKGLGIQDDTTTYKLIGPLAGLTFSKGAPGGPVVGEMYHTENIYRGKKADLMPTVHSLIKQDKIDEAIDAMRSIGMPNAEINMVLKYAQDPGARLNQNNMKKFYKHADEEAQERMEKRLNER